MSSKFICTRWAVQITSMPNLLQLKKAMAVIQPEERKRLLQFHFLDDMMLSLVGRLLMRKFIADNTNIPYHKVKFERDANNKPYWLQTEAQKHISLNFSISHQGNMIVLGGIVAPQNMDPKSFGIGVDIAQVESTQKPLAEYFRIMSRIFTLEEWKYIRKQSFNLEQQLHAFMRLWALKEAYTKEQGVGVFMNLGEISFDVKSDQSDNKQLLDTQVFVKGVLQPNYKFEEHFLLNKYCVAIAYRDVEVAADSFEFLDIHDLLVDNELTEEENIKEDCLKALEKQIKKNGIFV